MSRSRPAGKRRRKPKSEAPVPVVRASPPPIPPVSSIAPPPRTFWRWTVRMGRRLLAMGAFAGVAFVGYTFVAEPYLLERANNESASATAEQPPPRPASAPDQIPPWAWELHQWHSTPEAERGPRPAEAPARVPDWYWEWRAWRLQLGDEAPAPSS